jgi:cysteine desulfurase
MHRSIYLDYNATQPLLSRARDAMLDIMSRPANASSIHRAGQHARHEVERARRAVAGLIGARPDEILFTSGATEANATALRGIAARRVFVSAIEHPSVAEAAPGAQTIPVTSDGVIDLAALDRVLAEGAGDDALVSVMLVNNETGVIQPVAEAARIVHASGGLLHCDAAQAPGRIQVDVGALAVDLLTLSAHKIGGPQGAGALYIRDGLGLTPLLRGGGQEGRRRAGTENVAAIAGFGVAASLAAESADLSPLRDRMEAMLAARAPGLAIYGRNAPRVGNTSCFGAPGLPAETALIALDLAGIAVSSGAACSSGAVEPSRVLLAMGVPDHAARAAIRVSLGWATEPDDIDRLVETWAIVYRRALSAAAPRVDSEMRELSA